MSAITEKTKIELYAVIVTVPVFVAFIAWLSSVAYSANNAEKKVAELQKTQEDYNTLLISVKEDLVLIKYKLQIERK
jgi:hypothetical protein